MYQRINFILIVAAIFTFVIVVTSSLAFGEDISSCSLKKTPDEQNYCKASFAGSGTFCDMIKKTVKIKENAIFWLSRFKELTPISLKNTSLLNLRKTPKDSQKRNNST